jgi:flagellar basal-body rod protein FlgB
MDLTNIPLISAISRKMTWLTARQKVLAQNVANIDTPLYKAVDLEKADFSSQLSAVSRATGIKLGSSLASAPRLQPTLTNAADIPGTGSFDAGAPKINTVIEDRSINGNTTSLEDEMMKVSQTAADYQMMTELYQRQVNMFDTALDKGS